MVTMFSIKGKSGATITYQRRTKSGDMWRRSGNHVKDHIEQSEWDKALAYFYANRPVKQHAIAVQ